MLHIEDLYDQFAIARHAIADMETWQAQIGYPPIIDVVTVYDEASRAFAHRVNAAPPGDQYIDDEPSGRTLYTTLFIEQFVFGLTKERLALRHPEDAVAASKKQR